jgi:hypothetical protein
MPDDTEGGDKKMTPTVYAQFINFLKEELFLSNDSIEIAEKSVERNSGSLPIALWQYGLITLEELDKIYDWLAMG